EPLGYGMADQLEQFFLLRRVDAGGNVAGRHSHPSFPRSRCSDTACSSTVAFNRSISALASSSSICSALRPRLPGTAAVNASIAPLFAVAQIVRIVVRSTP